MRRVVCLLALLALARRTPRQSTAACLGQADREAAALALLAAGPEPQHTRSGVERQDLADWQGVVVTLTARYQAQLRERCR
jgi:hypothetical protein